jgi:hypothetical protein
MAENTINTMNEDQQTQPAQLRKYIRDDNRNPIGIIVAERRNNNIIYGWSFCCKKDRFNKEFGLKIAQGRLLTGTVAKIPRVVEKTLENFKERAAKYFKTCTSASVPVKETSSLT